MYFEIKYAEEKLAEEPGDETAKANLSRLEIIFEDLYEEHRRLAVEMKRNSSRAIVVFDTIVEKEQIERAFYINGLSKFRFYVSRLFGVGTKDLSIFSDPLSEPQEVNWKYIGEKSVHKTKVRLETTVIGLGFMLLCFILLYFPIVKIDEEKIEDPGLGSALNLVISLVIQTLALVYRLIILRLIPSRKPSTLLAESYFVVITTVIFHFFFYVVAPGTYFVVSQSIHPNVKLKQLFVAVVTFLVMTIIVAKFDMKYKLYKGRRKKLLYMPSFYQKYCQYRLHEELTPPSFPVEWKLMVILDIWAFNAFYLFEIPYLVFLFMIILFVLYWIDKRNLYDHYKSNSYLSIKLEVMVQKTFIVFFLICVSLGYAAAAVETWQYYFIGGVFILSLILNFALVLTYSRDDKKKVSNTISIKNFVELNKQAITLKQSMLGENIKTSFLELNESDTQSLASAVFDYGYQESYESHLSRFKNKTVNQMLQQKYKQISKKSIKRTVSEMADLKGRASALGAIPKNKSAGENTIRPLLRDTE